MSLKHQLYLLPQGRIQDDNEKDGAVGDQTSFDIEYDNMQLENMDEDECHPIDDDRSPVCSDVEADDIEIDHVRDFVNNYFDDDFWQMFAKEVNFQKKMMYLQWMKGTML
ncbi:hypothetical protein MKX01_022517 [Papaver californicum]|nr:hypothetical protein MKX01_022517 [Papaver californicum]